VNQLTSDAADGNGSTRRGRAPQVLVLSPTRELAKQTGAEFDRLGGRDVATTTIYGGVPYFNQEKAFSQGVDVVVGTPGRLIDHIQNNNMSVEAIRYVVLDEADEMLKMGFEKDMESILNPIREVSCWPAAAPH
jgi:ATP-dependent RNA helicase DDX21